MTENKYRRFIEDTTPGSPTHGRAIQVDIYDVLGAFGVTCPAIQHAIKKLFRAGQGAKSERQDLEEAMASIQRAIDALLPETGPTRKELREAAEYLSTFAEHHKAERMLAQHVLDTIPKPGAKGEA